MDRDMQNELMTSACEKSRTETLQLPNEVKLKLDKFRKASATRKKSNSKDYKALSFVLKDEDRAAFEFASVFSAYADTLQAS